MDLKKALVSVFLTATVAVGLDSEPKPAPAEAGNEACSKCHSEIYSSYIKTMMANASGDASEAVITGEFSHKPSGVSYRVYKQDNRAWMSYERDGDDSFHGQRQLLYFIGSGKKGRSYLFSVQGFLFETPINWYSQEGRWNMTPAYTAARESPMTLPAFVDCLNCHTSGLQPPLAGTENKFSGRPFLHSGITCERCHGAASRHVEGKGGIVNPAKLAPERRDSICMECHFEGTVTVEQRGKHRYQFQPGDDLTDYIHYFLLTGNQPQTPRSLNQYEALSLSACKRKSGNKMWCVSCHDPHKEPAAADKASYYRGKCLACHGEAFAEKHHASTPDCVGCHMPSLPSKDVAHTQATDHRILRDPGAPQLASFPDRVSLMSFPQSEAVRVTTRDLALAWETLSQRDIKGASREAQRYLRKAVSEQPDDPDLLSALGFVEQQQGHEQEARELYGRTLKIDPLSNVAATNLAVLEAQSGHLRRAVELWQGAFDRVPHRSEIGINLVIAFCAAGQKEEARRYLVRVLDFNPDFAPGKQLLAELNRSPRKCEDQSAVH